MVCRLGVNWFGRVGLLITCAGGRGVCGWEYCINTTSGYCHSVLVAVWCAGWE